MDEKITQIYIGYVAVENLEPLTNYTRAYTKEIEMTTNLMRCCDAVKGVYKDVRVQVRNAEDLNQINELTNGLTKIVNSFEPINVPAVEKVVVEDNSEVQKVKDEGNFISRTYRGLKRK